MGRPTLTPGAMGDEGHDPAAEYLCTLQPRGCTRLADELGACRRRCTSELGQDQTGLYPLHVSVTGFFRATRLQLVQARSLLSELFSAGARNLHIEGHKIVVTSDGYVLIDVHAPGVAELARVFASRAADIGMHVRPKDVRHLSLASGRSPEEQLRVKEFFSGVPLGAFGMDLVLARLVRRASVPEASAAAAAHDFVEELRLPLPGSDILTGAGPAPSSEAKLDHISTPIRKRPCQDSPLRRFKRRTAHASLEGSYVAAAAATTELEEDITPAKAPKVDSSACMQSTGAHRAGNFASPVACCGH